MAAKAAAHDIYNPGEYVGWEPGVFVLQGNERTMLVHTKKDHHYRICTEKHGGTVDLKVFHDNQEGRITPGNCADVEGTKIEVAPATNLTSGTEIWGRFYLLK